MRMCGPKQRLGPRKTVGEFNMSPHRCVGRVSDRRAPQTLNEERNLWWQRFGRRRTRVPAPFAPTSSRCFDFLDENPGLENFARVPRFGPACRDRKKERFSTRFTTHRIARPFPEWGRRSNDLLRWRDRTVAKGTAYRRGGVDLERRYLQRTCFCRELVKTSATEEDQHAPTNSQAAEHDQRPA